MCSSNCIESCLFFKAPVRFFDGTPIGRIINRFSSDIYCVDDSLPFILNIFLAQAYGVFGVVIICCYGLPYFALVIAPLAVIYYYIQVLMFLIIKLTFVLD